MELVLTGWPVLVVASCCLWAMAGVGRCYSELAIALFSAGTLIAVHSLLDQIKFDPIHSAHKNNSQQRE
jgi:hypothetical protein